MRMIIAALFLCYVVLISLLIDSKRRARQEKQAEIDRLVGYEEKP